MSLLDPTTLGLHQHGRNVRIYSGAKIIGTNTVLLPGTRIGEGTVVGAGSLVNRDLAPWGIYVGSPARRIRERPSEQILAQEAALQASHPFQCIA